MYASKPCQVDGDIETLLFMLQGCCSRLESLAINGVNLRPSYHDMVTTLRHEIPNVRLAVASVGMKIKCFIS
jgi:hypothetical protein